MERIKTITKKWGNSFAVILPKKVVDTQHIEEGTEITITIETAKKMTAGDLMEFAKKHPLPKSKKTTEKIMREIDDELWPEEN